MLFKNTLRLTPKYSCLRHIVQCSSNVCRRKHVVSRLFQPQNILPYDAEVKREDTTSKSQKLMLDMGIIRQANTGFFHLLPLGERALTKLVNIVDDEMELIGAQKMLFPLLQAGHLWDYIDSSVSEDTELFALNDRHNKKLVLSPTHEDAVTELIASIAQLSYRQLPLRLYQMASKFRDEMKPRSGLLRAREFLMKDLYTFDTTFEAAQESYNAVSNAYNSIFNKIGVKFVRVLAGCGEIKGCESHEYHFFADVGEDELFTCQECQYAANKEVLQSNTCPQCHSATFEFKPGIEVGHTFLLGTEYSLPRGATFLNSQGKPEPVKMGSYGLGMTRILAAAVESLSLPNQLRWPIAIAPFTVCIIPPKSGSKEAVGTPLSYQLYEMLDTQPQLKNNIILDDRMHLTIGKRLRDAQRTGYPFVVVVGKTAMQSVPQFEVHDLLLGKISIFSGSKVVEYILKKTGVL